MLKNKCGEVWKNKVVAGAENRGSEKQGEEAQKTRTRSIQNPTKHTSSLRAAAYPIQQIHFKVRKKKTYKVKKDSRLEKRSARVKKKIYTYAMVFIQIRSIISLMVVRRLSAVEEVFLLVEILPSIMFWLVSGWMVGVDGGLEDIGWLVS